MRWGEGFNKIELATNYKRSGGERTKLIGKV